MSLLRLAIIVLLRCKMDTSLVVFAICCSSWVACSRGSTRRSRDNPMGSRTLPKVVSANEMVSRVCLLVQLSMAVGATWLVEQPSTSLVWLHERMQDMLRKFQGQSIRVAWFAGELYFVEQNVARCVCRAQNGLIKEDLKSH